MQPTPDSINVEEKNVQDSTPVTQEISVPEGESAPKSSKDWERFREARAKERKEAEELAKAKAKSDQESMALRAALDSVLNKPQQQQPQSDYYGNSGEDEDARIERKVQEQIAKRELENERQRKAREQEQLPQALAQNHANFNEVCSTENLDYLEYHHPEIATPFKYMPEGYEKWSAIYKAVKKFVPNNQSNNDVRKAERNLNKPQSLSSPAVSAPGQGSLPAVLDESRKKANWDRMQRTLKGLE